MVPTCCTLPLPAYQCERISKGSVLRCERERGGRERAGGKRGGGGMPNHIYFYFYRGREREEYEWMD